MTPPDKLPLVKTAMQMLVDTLTPSDRVAIVVYAGASGVGAAVDAAATSKAAIQHAIEQLHAGGSTNGAAGIQLAYDLAAENFVKGGINRVILATDGDFNVGVTSQDELIAADRREARDAASSCPSSASAPATSRTRRWRSWPTRGTATTRTSTRCTKRGAC